MKNSKEKALKLIDEKIVQFEKLLSKASDGNFDKRSYDLLCSKTIDLLASLFPEEKINELCEKVRIFWISETSSNNINYEKVIQNCIIQLKECKATIAKSV